MCEMFLVITVDRFKSQEYLNKKLLQEQQQNVDDIG